MLAKWDSFFLIMLLLPVMGHVIVLPLILDVAGRDAWIAVLISLPFALLYVYLIYRIRIQHPNNNFQEFICSLLGKPLGNLLRGIFSVYFLFLSIFSAIQLIDMIHIGFLPETPNKVLVFWFLIFCLYAAKKGIKAIALTSGILCIFAVAIGYLVSFTSAPMKDWGNLRPILEFGWPPVLTGTLVLLSIWAELIFLLVVPFQNVKEKGMFRNWVIGIIWNAVIMIAAMTGTVMIFGLGQASNFLYPALEIVRITSLGFIDRFDTYAMVLMSFGCYIRTSLYLRLTYELSAPAKPKWLHHSWLYGLWVGMAVCCLYVVETHMRVHHFSLVDIYGIVLFPVVLSLFLISSFRNRRSRILQVSKT